MTREELFEEAKLLPATPGVYIMHSKDGTVIYVGKSKALCNRVSSYFAPYAHHNVKTSHMVASVYSFEVYHTKTELEAFLLENSFIKQYMPRYNIKLKDSKSYPYIELTGGEYPKLDLSYTNTNPLSRYFGPYSSAFVARSIITAAQKAFKLPSCKMTFPKDIGKCRPCLNFHIGRCMGVCQKNAVSKEEYQSIISDALRFLKGDFSFLIKELEKRMEAYSEDLLFEKAASVRDTIKAVSQIRDKQHIVTSPNVSVDVIGWYSDDLGSVVTVFFVRGGAVIDREAMYFGADELLNSGAMTSLLYRFYKTGGFVPEDIITSFPLSDEDTENLISGLCETKKITVTHPIKGEKMRLSELADTNAKELALHKRETESRSEKFMISLAEFLSLEVVPSRIEAYDVSNSGNENIVCGMAVWENGRFSKKKYRSFTMKSVDSQDDYSSMKEAVERRLSHTDGDWSYPDLILLDGGNNHVSVIRSLLEEKNVSIPIFGMIKDEHHKTRVITDGENEIGLHKRQDIFNFIYKFQEEVHNVAFSAMDVKRRKSITTSSLEEIDGVGKAISKRLLDSFGGLSDKKTPRSRN